MALFAVILALAGAPANTSVNCYPGILPGSAWGAAYIGEAEIHLYGPKGCAAAIFLRSTPAERIKLEKLNPSINWRQTVGEGTLVDLHEAEHIALASRDECLVEKTAFSKLQSALLAVPPAFALAATNFALSYHVFVLAHYKC